MKIINVHEVPENSQFSPKGNFGSHFKNLSAALGARHKTNPTGTPQPFDLQIRRIPPGKSVCPFHSHAAQWELFTILSGQARVRHGSETHHVKAGDVFMQPPGTPHQLTNASDTEDLVVQIIANNPEVDVCHYPDSNKMGVSSVPGFFRTEPAEYFDGEE